jgi:hypothetical protein
MDRAVQRGCELLHAAPAIVHPDLDGLRTLRGQLPNALAGRSLRTSKDTWPTSVPTLNTAPRP